MFNLVLLNRNFKFIVKLFFSKQFILIVMVMFSLIGQSSASMMMSCDMMNMSDMPMSHSMDSADHSMDMSMDASTTTSMTADCCQENCDCATASCNPNSYTNSLTTLAITPLYSDSSNQEVALPQTQFLNYLFKPPIS